MNLKRIKCMIVGHDWKIDWARSAKSIIIALRCSRCGHCEHERAVISLASPARPAPPMSAAEMPACERALSDRVKIDDAKDIVTIDGHPITGCALSFFTNVTPPGRGFRITSAEPGGAIVVQSLPVVE